MWSVIGNIALSLAVSTAAFFGLSKAEPYFGTTITTINGSDTLTSSRSVINTNFANLNANKFELSYWYSTTTARQLVEIGIQNATSKAVTVTYGGTGSTTLSSNQVLLGNGTSNIKTVTGWGTSGQFLTSGGPGAAPTWTSASVDGTLDFNFTGATRVKNLHASSTVANPMTLNGLTYSLPSVRGASSTVLMEDAAGALTWSNTFNAKLYTTATSISTSQTSSTTVLALTIPANQLGISNAVRCQLLGVQNSAGPMLVQNGATLWVSFSYGASGTTTVNFSQVSGSQKPGGTVWVTLVANGATNAQSIILGTDFFNGQPQWYSGTASADSTTSRVLYVAAKGSGASTYLAPDQILCEHIR